MIRVQEKPEPEVFHATVRVKGQRYFLSKGIDPQNPLPEGVKLNPYWRDCLDDLYHAYDGVCAYLAIYFERAAGAATVDHFIAKSSNPALAYEWSNYRLACSMMNTRKNDYDDVLDPFLIEDGWFHLDFLSGSVFPNPNLSDDEKKLVSDTISRLHLDNEENRGIRIRHFQYYLDQSIDQDHLRKTSPFVWLEAQRQELL